MVRGVRGDRVLRGTHRQIGCMWTLECPLTFADYFESKTSVCRFDPLFVLSLFDPAPIRLSVCCSPCAYTCVFVTVGQTNQKIVSIICPEERRSAHPLSGHVLFSLCRFLRGLYFHSAVRGQLLLLLVIYVAQNEGHCSPFPDVIKLHVAWGSWGICFLLRL